MKEFSKIFIRVSSLLLSLLMIVGVFAAVSISANAATQTKVEKSYEIAVVFDNSGSMYTDGNKAWCRAKYAMEIFASMLNYDNGDKLRIYPMWQVTTDGSKPNSGGSYAAIQINSKSDIDKISKMYTVNPDNTPFAPVTEAQKYLKTSKATEKWIIVLTDGEFNQIERGKNVGTLSSVELKKRLISVATNGIKVQYLGFGEASKLQEDKSKNFFAKKSSDTSLKDDLVGICNSIFQRSVLPSDRLSGKTLNLDLSMKNLIVFAQGPNAKIDSLTDESGKKIDITLDSKQRKYSTIKAKGCDGASVDNTLAGQVVTFAECPKGKYSLNYSGAEAIQIFYEPDVDIKVALTNSDGQVVDGSTGKITAGDYTISSKIVDSKTGDDVTNHKLMGNEVKLTTKVKQSGDSDYKEYANGSKISFEPDSSTDIKIVGTYLKDYTITSEGSPELSWLNGIKIESPVVDFKIKASVQQSQSWYNTKDYDNWKPIRVSMTIDSKPLTDEQLKNTKLSVSTSDDLKYRYEALPGESAYNVYIAQDESGKYVEPDNGKHKLDVSAVYADEYGKETPAKDSVSFDIKWYGKFWQWLKWLIIIAAIIATLVFVLTRKAWPYKMSCITEDGGRRKIKVGKKICLIPIDRALWVKAEKNSILLHKFSRRASVKVHYYNTNVSVDSFSIDGLTYSRSSDFMCAGETYSGVVCNGTSFSVSFNDGQPTQSGEIKIN